ncbi:MAG: hypothetical protein GEV08_07705 [Acidimicrobiia bacterium]|nr:hypothetical protein [Acidimicrobiia bacterium]
MPTRSRGSLQLSAVAAADPAGAGGDVSERIDPTGLGRLRSAALLCLVVLGTGLAMAAVVTGVLLAALYVVVRALSG